MRLIRREKETLSRKRMKNKENKINVRQGTDDVGKTSKQRKKTCDRLMIKPMSYYITNQG